MQSNYANKWRSPLLMGGGSLKVRSRLESEEAGVIMCHYSGLRRGGKKTVCSLILTSSAENSFYSSLIRRKLKLNG